MKRINKVVIMLLISIIAIVGFYTKANAYYVGQTVGLGESDYKYNKDLYCTEYLQRSTYCKYKIISQVKIVGNESTDYEGKKITSWHNAKLAYILSASNGNVRKGAGQVQRSVWSYLGTWVNNVGKFHKGITEDFAKTNGFYPSLLKEAENYANRIKNIEAGLKIKDNTDKSKIKVKVQEKDGKQYMRVGPFKWTYSGTLTNVTVKDQNGKAIKDVKFSYYTGDKENWYDKVSSIKSGKNFYVSLPLNTNITEIKQITGTVETEVKSVNIWFLQAASDSHQNFIFRQPSTGTLKDETSLDYNIPTQRDLTIIKVDADEHEIKLDNVGFKLQHKETGLYVKQTSDGKVKYVEESKATEFKTKNGGKFTVKNLIVGTYVAVETKNPNFGYEMLNKGVSIKLSVDDMKKRDIPQEKIIENKPTKRDGTIIKVDKDHHEITLEGVKFILYHNETKRYVKQKSTGELEYVKKKADATEFKTDKNGKIELKNARIGTYKAYETENPDLNYEKIEDGITITINENGNNENTIENERTTRDLIIEKVNKQNQKVKLPGVEFIIKYKDEDKYVIQDNNGNISYGNESQATVFKTGADGRFTVPNLKVGTYIAYEKNNPNYGYEMLEEGIEIPLYVEKIEDKNNPYIEIIGNKQVYVKLSGYVWEDIISPSKVDKRNDLYRDDSTLDDQDTLLNGITVRLKDRTTNEVVQETKTSQLNHYTNEPQGNDGNGEYLFMDVLIEKLKDYYIEFEYDGLIYTNVVYNTTANNGSKAIESEQVREEFNNGFASVEGGEQRDTGITRNLNGEKIHDLYYTIDEAQRTATLDKTKGYYPIIASLDSVSEKDRYVIEKHFEYGQEEVKYINLGLYQRSQPNVNLLKDLHDVKLTINGKNFVYPYDRKQKIIAENEAVAQQQGKDLNLGVKFKNQTFPELGYKRAIYEADYTYESEDKSRELQVYLTYRLMVDVEGGILDTRINSIVDYYDSNYQLNAIGKKEDFNEQTAELSDGSHFNEQTGQLKNSSIEIVSNEGYNDNYKKLVIRASDTAKQEGILTVPAGKTDYVFVQFKLNREAVVRILNNGEVLDNVAEINSYTTLKDGKIYAGIDRSSNPGNAIPGNEQTYEGDTDFSPALQLEVADNARQLAGTAFVDNPEGEGFDSNAVNTGKIRIGNGEYNKETEKTIAGVQVTLQETTGSGKVYDAVTGEDGSFLIQGYIPGNYTLTYTWGDKTYKVQNYKATVYKNQDRQTNPLWYKETSPRYSDAMDDYELRKKIDDETKQIAYNTKQQLDAEYDNPTGAITTKMNSTTPLMNLEIEYDAITDTAEPQYVYKVENIDFGIIERAKQQLELTKRVASLKATLANGEVLTDLTIKEDGTIEGNRDYVTYMKPESGSNGFIRLEMDNELLQGTKLEVTYEIKATNKSEKEYLSPEFYNYGRETGDLATLTPAGIIEYLDKNWAFDQANNTVTWNVKSQDDIKNMVQESVYQAEDTTIGEKMLLYTDSLKNNKLQPGETASVNLNVSKILTTAADISLDNETELTNVEKSGGSIIETTPGNYTPGKGKTEADDSMAETTIVTPSTGDNKNYILPAVISIIAFAILGTGVYVIKKKILK